MCSYWSTLAEDDAILFLLGFLLGKFAEKLNFCQLLCFAREIPIADEFARYFA